MNVLARPPGFNTRGEYSSYYRKSSARRKQRLDTYCFCRLRCKSTAGQPCVGPAGADVTRRRACNLTENMHATATRDPTIELLDGTVNSLQSLRTPINNYTLSSNPYSTTIHPTPRRGEGVRGAPFRGWVDRVYTMGRVLSGVPV